MDMRWATEGELADGLGSITAGGRENAVPWYTGTRKTDRNWPAYETRLRRSLTGTVVEGINDASDKVVAMLAHPGTRSFDSRGLVVGHVRSGKTSNFTAVISRAADRGYRMFTVLSGIHNSLRRQTQSRLIGLPSSPGCTAFFPCRRITPIHDIPDFARKNAHLRTQ